MTRSPPARALEDPRYRQRVKPGGKGYDRRSRLREIADTMVAPALLNPDFYNYQRLLKEADDD